MIKSKLSAILSAGLLVALLAGCHDNGSSAVASDSSAAPAPINRAPAISGTPPASATVGKSYDFTPTASDPNGDPLKFSVINKPTWAIFNTVTGQLHGTPTRAEMDSGVAITVTDGTLTAGLPGFSITVAAAPVAGNPPTVPPAPPVASASATLSWIVPVQNEDGTPLTDLAGFHIHYGATADAMINLVNVADPTATRFVVDQLAPATYFFSITSYTASGVESTQVPPIAAAIS